jgi:hypothetical protein
LAVLILLLGWIGLANALLQGGDSRRIGISLLAVIAYFVATIAVVGLNAYARHRSMIVPVWCIFAASGLHWLLSRVTGAREIQVGPANETMGGRQSP